MASTRSIYAASMCCLLIGCTSEGETHLERTTPPAAGEPGAAKADRADEGSRAAGRTMAARSRLARLPGLGAYPWPPTLSSSPTTVPGDRLLEETYARAVAEPNRAVYVHFLEALATLVGIPAPEVDPKAFVQTYSRRYVHHFGVRSLPALMVMQAERQVVMAGIPDRLVRTRAQDEVMRALEPVGDAPWYLEALRRLVSNARLSDEGRARVLRHVMETAGNGLRYRADGSLRTVLDGPPTDLGAMLDRARGSESARFRRIALTLAADTSRLTPADIATALADPDYRVRLAAAPHLFAVPDRDEAAQARFVSGLNDAQMQRQIRLDWILSRGFPAEREDLFAEYPGDVAATLREVQATFVGQALMASPPDQRIGPLLAAAATFIYIPQLTIDALDVLRASTAYSIHEKAAYVGQILAGRALGSEERADRALCAFATSLAYERALDTAEIRPFLPCWDASTEKVDGSFEWRARPQWPTIREQLLGSPETRRQGLHALVELRDFWYRGHVALGLLEATDLPEARRAYLDRWVRWNGYTAHEFIRAYDRYTDDAKGALQSLVAAAGFTPGQDPATVIRTAELYQLLPELVDQSGLEGAARVHTILALLRPKAKHDSLRRIFLASVPPGRWGLDAADAEWVVPALLRRLDHPSVTDDALLDALVRFALPYSDGAVWGEGVSWLVEAEVDPHFVARVMQASLDHAPEPSGHPKRPHPRLLPTSYFTHIVPGSRLWVPSEFLSARNESLRRHAQRFSATLPSPSDRRTWLGRPQLDPPPPAPTSAFDVLAALEAPLDPPAVEGYRAPPSRTACSKRCPRSS